MFKKYNVPNYILGYTKSRRIILHQFVTNNISILSSKLVSKVVNFWRLGVNFLVDLLASFLMSMVDCMSGNAFGCILWCPSAITSLPGLESFPLGSNGLFHMLIPRPGFTMPSVGPRCAIHLLSCLEQASLDVVPDILSGSISYTCRCTHMQAEDLLEMMAHLRVFKLPNFKQRSELAHGFWCQINPHVAYKKLMLQGYFLARDHFYICVKFAHGPTAKDEAYLHGYVTHLYMIRWLSCFFKDVFPRSRSNAKAYSRVLSSLTSGSGLPYPIPPCTSLYPVPAWPTCPFQSPYGIRNSDTGILAVQLAADQRTGP